MKQEKYDRGLAMKYFIQRKIIEILIFIGGIFLLYGLGQLEDPFLLFEGEIAMCQGFLTCIFSGFMVLFLLIIVGIIICLFLFGGLYILFKFIDWNWKKAKRKARLK